MSYLGETETDCVQERCVSTSELEGFIGDLNIHNHIQSKFRAPWMIRLILSRSCSDCRYNDSDWQIMNGSKVNNWTNASLT